MDFGQLPPKGTLRNDPLSEENILRKTIDLTNKIEVYARKGEPIPSALRRSLLKHRSDCREKLRRLK